MCLGDTNYMTSCSNSWYQILSTYAKSELKNSTHLKKNISKPAYMFDHHNKEQCRWPSQYGVPLTAWMDPKHAINTGTVVYSTKSMLLLLLLLPLLLVFAYLAYFSDHSRLSRVPPPKSKTVGIAGETFNGLDAISVIQLTVSKQWQKTKSIAYYYAKLQSNLHCQQTNTQLLQDGCPSCHPTNSVRALKETVDCNSENW